MNGESIYAEVSKNMFLQVIMTPKNGWKTAVSTYY